MEEHLKAGGEKLFDYRIQRTFTIGESKCKNNEESVKYAINVIVYNYITCITTCIKPKFFFYILLLMHRCIRSNAAAMIHFIAILKGNIQLNCKIFG